MGQKGLGKLQRRVQRQEEVSCQWGRGNRLTWQNHKICFREEQE